MDPNADIRKVMRNKSHPILAIWLVLLAVMVGITLLSLLSVIGIFLVVPFLPAVALCIVALGFGLSARASYKPWCKRLCIALCVAGAVMGIAGFPLLNEYYVHRPEPSVQEARTLLQAHEDTLRAAADTMMPGENFRAGNLAQTALPAEVRAALRIPGVTRVQCGEDGRSVRFTIHFPNYFGHKGDYRYLCYVPSDETEPLTPEDFQGEKPIETSQGSAFYAVQDGVWYLEWYTERLAPGWFYEVRDDNTLYPNEGKKRFGAY